MAITRSFALVAIASAAALTMPPASQPVRAQVPEGGGQPAPQSSSRVTALEIVSRGPAFGGRPFGAVGPYEILIGRARAVIDPQAALNAQIVDLDKAPRNAAGLVEYTFDVHILKPV